MKKRIIIGIFLFLIFGFCGVSSQYLYFGGNSDNGFQQGCSESYNIYYNLDKTATTAYLHVDLGKTLLTYGNNNPFTIYGKTVDGKTLSMLPVEYDDAGNNIINLGMKPVVDGTAIQQGTSKLWGSFSFTPKFSGEDYTGYLYIKYDSDADPVKRTTCILQGGKNVLNSGAGIDGQYAHLTGEFRVVRKPCQEDTKEPTIRISGYTNGAKKVESISELSFSIKDETNNGSTPNVYTGNNLWTGNKWGINDQTGVNQNSVTVKIEGNGHVGTYSLANGNLSMVADGTKTWGYTDRDYNGTVSTGIIENDFGTDFGIEEKITITVTGSDRLGHITGKTITFNEFDRPYEYGSHTPSSSSTNVSIDSKITFKLRDDWAGVDSGNIVVTLTGKDKSTNNSNYNKTYICASSGMTCTLVGTSSVVGNAAGYDVVINPGLLPAYSKIYVKVTYEDLKGYTGETLNWSFDTRQKCSALSCCDGTIIYTGGETGISYTGEVLYVSGGNNIDVRVETGYVYSGTLTGMFLVINCNYVGLTLFKGVPGNAGDGVSVPYNRLVFSGSNNSVKGILSGNVLTLKYYIDDAELILLQPYSGQEYRSNNNVDFQWQLSGWVGSETTRYSLYVVSSDTQPSDWGDPIYVTNDLTARVGLDNANSYRWRIVAEDGNQIEAFTGTFLVDVNSIATTTVITPINLSGTIASRTSTGLYLLDDMVLEWSVDVGQGSGDLTKFEYEVYQGNQCLGTPFATGAVDIQSQGVIPTTGQIYRLLEEGEYCWQVRVLDTNNNTSPSWTGKTFVVSNPYCAKTDSKLTLLSPENNAQLYNSDVTLRWSGNWDDCIAGQSGYHVELYSGTVGDTTDMITSGNYDSLTELLSISLSGGQYRWRVKMLSSDVEGEWKNSSFEIVSMMDPNNLINFELVLDEPVSGQNPADRNVSFRWHVNGTGVGTLMYDINIYTGVINDTENSTLIANGVDLITTGFDRLLPNGDGYRWEVTVRDNYENPSITEFTGSFDLNVSKNVRGVEITQISPVGSEAPGDIVFEWNGNIPTDGEGVVSHYEVRVHEGDCAGDIIYTGNNLSIETTGFTTQITEGGNYCREIWAVDTDGYTGGRVETGFILSSELIIKVNLGWGDVNNKSRGKFFLYESGNKDAPKYSGYVNIGTDGTGSFNEIVEPGYYDVIFKDWQYLSVYQTGQYIDGSSKIIDFTDTGITMGLTESGYLWYGDFPNLDNGEWVYSFNINGVDFSFVYTRYCMSGNVQGFYDRFHRICDLNQDGSVTVDDGSAIVKYLVTMPDDPIFKEKDGGLYKGFGSLDYGIVDGLHTDDEKWSNYVSLYDNR